ncbi:MAG: twin-arginine translocase TatA/TatE family subunit [Acidimicrobiales bacterium]
MLAIFDSPTDILIVLAVILLLFGSTQLPKLARSLGSASKEFKKGVEEGETAAQAKAAAAPQPAAPTPQPAPTPPAPQALAPQASAPAAAEPQQSQAS